MEPRKSPSRQDNEAEELRRRQKQEGSESRSSARPESDGEDFNQGGRSRSRTEATGEDF